jgi:F-type H+-transporting ATPase subunit gamma
MAQNLQQLKRRIKTAGNIAQIAKAMEMISASKIKKAQSTVLAHKPYAQKIEILTKRILQNLSSSKFTHPYLEVKESKTLYIILSPDKGLCGSLNTNLFRKLLEVNLEQNIVVTVGKRAQQFCERMGITTLSSFNMGTRLPNYRYVYSILEIIKEQYATDVRNVEIIYTGFNSVFSQTVSQTKLLPIEKETTEENSEQTYIFEPGMTELLEDLLPYYVEVKLYNVLLEAHTSEQAARMIAMQNAKNNALDIAAALTLSYNKSRQERITNEILSLGNNLTN